MTLILDMANGTCNDSDKPALEHAALPPHDARLVPAAPLLGLQTATYDADRLSAADKAAIRQHLLAIGHKPD